MSGPLRVAILGSTGSIGRQALEVAAAHPDKVTVVALAAATSAARIAEQAAAFGVSHVALLDEPAAAEAGEHLASQAHSAEIAAGPQAIVDLASLPDVDVVLNAMVGAAGLKATIAALDHGKVLALANKESLVVGGDLVMSRVTRADQLLPVDSEHSAIFQCMTGEHRSDITRIWLTASGGPFRGRTRDSLQAVTRDEALAHPTWSMGPKITIDSATLMNKGLEVIEAHHLFGIDYDDIRVVVHPQSCVHSMVEFADGSVKAHLGVTDMRIPIQYAFSHPRRWTAPLQPVDFTALGTLDFEPPDTQTFGCLRLAFEAGRVGGTLPAAMNAANEVAVEVFLAGGCGLLDIESTVSAVMEQTEVERVDSVDQLVAVDGDARKRARRLLEQ